ALTVLANLTFAPAVVALGASCVAWAWGQRRRLVAECRGETFRWFWSNLGRPGAIVILCLALPFIKLRPRHFYYGAATASESIHSLVGASFAHPPQQWPFDNTAAWYLQGLGVLADSVLPCAAVILAVLWAATALPWLRAPSSDPPDSRMMLFHLAAGS